MIKRSKALLWVYDKPQMVNMMNYIYDSRGECQDCKFLGDRGVFCIEHGFFVPKNAYCWKFEKETEDE